MLPTTTDVLVVGAGPVGLATAVTLAQQGVDVTVVDQQAAGANTSRAAVIHPRTLEVLDRIGVTERLAEVSLRTDGFTVRDRERVLVALRFSGLPSRHDYMFMVSQAVTEKILLDRLTELGGVVHRPVAVTGLTRTADAVDVTLSSGDVVAAGWVVGADGMHSTVRELSGIRFGADRDGESFTLADVRVSGDLPADEVVLYFSADGMLVSAPLPDGSVRFVAGVDAPPELPDVEYVQGIVDRRGPGAGSVTVEEVVWGSRFRVHHRVADRFRDGRVLLAGDAAHVHSPAGGQGMNLGLRDAVALGDALGAVLAGAPQSRLDEYAASRRPVAEEVVAFADRLTRVATAGPRMRQIRNVMLRLLARHPAFRRGVARRLAGLTDTGSRIAA